MICFSQFSTHSRKLSLGESTAKQKLRVCIKTEDNFLSVLVFATRRTHISLLLEMREKPVSLGFVKKL